MNSSSMSAPEVRSFSGADYGVLSVMLALSLSIGFYQACSGGKQKTAEEFLMANRNMHPVPVALSLTASFISAITFLGTPAENYVHGIMHSWNWLSTILSSIATVVLFMPTFYELGLTSSNEYLERRFCRAVRLLGTFAFTFYMLVYLGIVLYAPSLALNAVTGLSLWGSVFSIGIVCTLYTAIGGMKAVLWTDVFQITLMITGFIAVIIQGSIRLGGLDKAWHIAKVGERLDYWVWSTDVTIRHTIWGLVIGGGFNWASVFAVNQAQVQRYLTCGSLQRARMALLIATFGMIVVQVLPHIVGVVMYGNYVGCDPKLHGAVDSYDQMMPYFIMDLFGSIPGLPGLLTSAVFSAALSTISSGLNALAAVAGEDVVKAIWPDIKDSKYTRVTKGLAMGFGVISMFSAMLASQMGAILQISMNIFGMFGGPILGLFSSGMFFPWVNSKGVMTGTLLGLVYSFWLGIGVQFYPNPPNDPPLTIDDCPVSNTTYYSTNDSVLNTTYYSMTDSTTNATYLSTTDSMAMTAVFENFTTAAPHGSALRNFYKLSYTWYGVSSWFITVVVANIVSFLTGPQDPKKLDPRLICPIVDKMYCCLPEKWKIPLRCGVGEEYDEEEYKYQAMETKETDNVVHAETHDQTEIQLKTITNNGEDA